MLANKNLSGHLLYSLILACLLNRPVMADELADLKAQLEVLRQRVAALEQQPADEAPLQTAGAETIDTDKLLKAGSMRGSWLIPGTDTSMRINGFIRAHMIYDIGPRPTSSGGDVASTRRAKLPGTPEYDNRGDVRIAGRDARFTIQTSTPSPDFGNIRTFIQGDFKGDPDDKASRATTNRTTFTMRHAYGEVGNWLMGHTYSTYLDNSVFGDKVDPTGPQGRSMVRQGQFRYTHHFDDKRELAFGIENPRGDFVDADDDNLHDGYPDISMHYRHETNEWMYQVGAMVRRMGIKQVVPVPADDEVFGWGVNTSGMYMFPNGRNRITWLINLGDGVGRYLESGSDQGASITQDGKLDTQFGYGGFITFKHWWTDTISSNVDFGASLFDLNPDEDPEANRKLFSSHMNVIWTPISQLEFGLEYVWGHRVVKDGRSGDISRIMVNTIFNF